MPDRSINQLPVSPAMSDDGLLVIYQNNTTNSIRGSLIKSYAVAAAQAQAQAAAASAQEAQQAAESIGESVSQAQASAQQAQAAQQAIENLGVTSETLPVGQGATVTKTVDASGAVTLGFGIPQGPQGPEGPQGGPGATGPQGEPGKAATIEIGSVTTGTPGTQAEVTNSGTAEAAVLNFTIPQGPQGEKGDTGPQGPQGETGEGFVVKGYFATLSALQSGVPSPSAGDAYGVGSAEPYDIYIWDGVNSAWVNNGPLQGAKGPQGDPGSAATIEIGTVTTAPAGSNAAVTNSGTSSAAVLNFTIPQGATGPQGPAGVDGSPGPAGADGAPGAPGPQGEPGQNATINGVTTLTLTATGGLTGEQDGGTYTLNGNGLVQKVEGAVAGNVALLTSDGGIQDSGKSIGSVMGVTCVDATSSDGIAYTASVEGMTSIPDGAVISIVPNMDAAAYEHINLNVNGLGAKYLQPMEIGKFAPLSGGGVSYSKMLSRGRAYLLQYNESVDVWVILSSPSGSVYYMSGTFGGTVMAKSGSQPESFSCIRNIKLQSSTPSTVPSGELVGVYE